jgi:hypothetical protein
VARSKSIGTIEIPRQITVTAASTLAGVAGYFIAKQSGKDATLGVMIGSAIGTVAGVLIEMNS